MSTIRKRQAAQEEAAKAKSFHSLLTTVVEETPEAEDAFANAAKDLLG